MGTNKCISRDLSVLLQTIECFGMLPKKEWVQSNGLEHFQNTSSEKRMPQTNAANGTELIWEIGLRSAHRKYG